MVRSSLTVHCNRKENVVQKKLSNSEVSNDKKKNGVTVEKTYVAGKLPISTILQIQYQ